MKILKTLSLSVLLSLTALTTPLLGQDKPAVTAVGETPAKTVFMKNPALNDVATFFSTHTTIDFEIYKPGTKENLVKIVAALKKDPNVETCSTGNANGDYQSISLALKAAKDKMWFAALLKKAGLNMIKINNNPIVEVEKM